MEASRKMMLAVLFMVLVLVGDAQATYTVKNQSSKDIVLIPVIDVNVKIVVKVGATVEVPAKYKECRVKNLGNGATSKPIALVDGGVVVVLDGLIKGTVKLVVAVVLDGVLSIFANALVLIQI